MNIHAMALSFYPLLYASGWSADAGGKIRHPEIRGASAAASADAGESSLHSP